jgi:hypothetical protein
MDNSIGVGANADFMWLNYFTATTGCEVIYTITLTWGLIDNGGPCRVILYDDPDDDGNPDDAVYLSEASITVANAYTNILTNVSITPTTVNGGFFVAALYSVPAGVSNTWPAPIDQTATQANSWAVWDSFNGFDVNNLMNNDGQPVLIDNYFPGNWMLRAEGPLGPVTACEYRIDLYDHFGDSWNGGYLDVLVNGDIVLNNITLPGGSGPASYNFIVPDGGGNITTIFTAGGWAYECYYYIYDSEGTQVWLSDGYGNSSPPPDILPGQLYAPCSIKPVPISNWALFIGIGLILVFTVVRFRKIV